MMFAEAMEQREIEFISLDSIPNGQRLIFSVHTSEEAMDEYMKRFTRKWLKKADASGLNFKRQGTDILIWKTEENPE